MKKLLLSVFLASFFLMGFSQDNPILKYVTDCDTTYIYDKDIQTSKKGFQSFKICLQGGIQKTLSENNCHSGQLFYFKDNNWILLEPQPIRSETLPNGYYYWVFWGTIPEKKQSECKPQNEDIVEKWTEYSVLLRFRFRFNVS